MKAAYQKILNDHGIYGEDAQEVIYAVQDMLDYVVEKTKKEEPYATNTISRLSAARDELFYLADVYA